MAKQKSSFEEEYGSRIPDPAVVRAHLAQHRKNKLFNEENYKERLAIYFMGLAQKANRQLGRETYDYTNPAEVLRQVGWARWALEAVKQEKQPDFFNRGFYMSLLVEGIADRRERSYAVIDKPFRGLTQTGVPAVFDAYLNGAVELARSMAAKLPTDHPFHPSHFDYSGQNFWERQLAIPIQAAIFTINKQRLMESLVGLGGRMDTEDKARLLAVSNIIPALGMGTVARLEPPKSADPKTPPPKPQELTDIRLTDFLDKNDKKRERKTLEMFMTNRSIFMKKGYKDKSEDPWEKRRAHALQNLLPDMRAVLDRVGVVTNANAASLLCETKRTYCDDPPALAQKASKTKPGPAVARVPLPKPSPLREARATLPANKVAEIPAAHVVASRAPPVIRAIPLSEAKVYPVTQAIPVVAEKLDREGMTRLAKLAVAEKSSAPKAQQKAPAAKKSPRGPRSDGVAGGGGPLNGY